MWKIFYERIDFDELSSNFLSARKNFKWKKSKVTISRSKNSFLGPRLQRSMDEFQHKINFEIKQKLRHQILSISFFWSKFSQRYGTWRCLNFNFKDLICMDFIFGQNNRYSSKINRFEYKQWRFFQNWIKKNEIINLNWHHPYKHHKCIWLFGVHS